LQEYFHCIKEVYTGLVGEDALRNRHCNSKGTGKVHQPKISVSCEGRSSALSATANATISGTDYR